MKNLTNSFNWHEELKNTQFDAIDKDFILLENPIIAPAFNYPFKVNVTTAVICIQGSMKGSINLVQYDTKGPCLFIVLADQILQHDDFSNDFSGLLIVMSKKFTDNLLINIQERLPLFLSVQSNPSTFLNEEDLESMKAYFYMLQKTVRMKDNPHRTEIVKHLMQAFFYGISYQFHKIPDTTKKSKQEVLVEKFLKYAQANFKAQRELEFYADVLCLTPKYLSKVVKEISGTSATEWIENYVIMESKALLKSTNMTIQQISDKLNFPSQSFFGKYFKRLVGVSPKGYKNS